MYPFVYLASQSPRRRQLLDQLGARHELLLPDAAEDAEALEAVLPRELAVNYVQRVTRAKLHAAQQRWARRGLPAAPILCSDTTVVAGRAILGKPADADDAVRMLGQLAGRTHRVLTAVAMSHDGQEALLLSTSRVTFEALRPEDIDRYVRSGDPFGKAGAYAIQGPAAAWIRRIDGSYSGIMGLPLFETASLLSQFKVAFGPMPA